MTRPGRRGHSPELRQAVVQAMAQGGKVRDVARLYGVSKASIWLWCREGGEKAKNVVSPPACHPDRRHYGKGWCRPCYRKQWDKDGIVESVK